MNLELIIISPFATNVDGNCEHPVCTRAFSATDTYYNTGGQGTTQLYTISNSSRTPGYYFQDADRDVLLAQLPITATERNILAKLEQLQDISYDSGSEGYVTSGGDEFKPPQLGVNPFFGLPFAPKLFWWIMALVTGYQWITGGNKKLWLSLSALSTYQATKNKDQ